jgi:hypothetical protein
MEDFNRNRREELVDRLAQSVLEGDGVIDSDLRHLVEEKAASLSGRSIDENIDLPPLVEPYVNKVAKHAYKVTNNDIEGLKEAGYSEDAIFEITICAALGAGLGRLERGLSVLKGASR